MNILYKSAQNEFISKKHIKIVFFMHVLKNFLNWDGDQVVQNKKNSKWNRWVTMTTKLK